MTRMRRQIGKSTGAAARIGRVMNGASSATTPTQRRAVSAMARYARPQAGSRPRCRPKRAW